MMVDPSESEQIKRHQQLDWDSAAAGWKKWWRVFERSAQHVSDRLVELAAVKPGDRVVDLATGTGEPALTAARRVGASGRIVAIDQSSGMIAVARERAAALGLANVDFRVGDIEALGLDAASFDAALCRWGLMFVPDLDRGLRAIRATLKSGARFATAVWSPPEKNPMISLGGDAVRRIAGLPPRPPDALDPFRLADVSILERALGNAGFGGVETFRVAVSFEFASLDEFTEFRNDVSTPFRAMMARCTPAQRNEIMRALADAAAAYRRPEGSLNLLNETFCVVSRAQ